jgi:hypothetical protein
LKINLKRTFFPSDIEGRVELFGGKEERILMESLKSNYRRAVFLWIAMMGGIFIYVILVEFLKSEALFLKKDSSSPEVMPIKYFLLSFAGLTLFLIWFVRSQILCGRAGKSFKNSSKRLLICSLATNLLCETVAITALSLFFLTRNPLDFYPLMVLSLVLFAYFFPRYIEWKEWVGKVEAVERPVLWAHPSLFQGTKLYQSGAPAPGSFTGQTEGSNLRKATQDVMHRPA